MVKRIVLIIASFVLISAALVSCTAKIDTNKVLLIEDVQIEDAIDIDIDISDGSEAFVADSNYISEAMFKYLYVYLKNMFLENCRSYESEGNNITGNQDIAVGDTEAFWNCEYKKDEDGTAVTMKDFLFEQVVSILKNMLAVEAAAEDCKFVYPETFNENLEKSIYSDVQIYGHNYLDEDAEYADENGVVYDWVKNRRKMYLATQGITADEWSRIFYIYNEVLASNIKNHFELVGVIKPASDEALSNQAVEYLKEQKEYYLSANFKIDYLLYLYEDDNNEDSQETSSEDISIDSSYDSGIMVEEQNKQILENSKIVLQKIKDGTTKFSDEKENADKYQEGFVVEKEVAYQAFGDDAKKCKDGDIMLFETNYGVYIVKFTELTDVDYEGKTNPTVEILEQLKEQSLYDSLNSYLEKYINAVKTDDKLLEKYKKPWNIR